MFELDSREMHSACWGDVFRTRVPDDTLRIVALNTAGLPTTPNHPKYHSLQAFILANDIDVICLSETNVAWQHVEETAHLSQVTRPWFRSCFCRTSWFRRFPSPSARQPGGVAILVRDSHSGRVMESGDDPSGLGRWVWVRLRGVGGQTTVVVSAYRPVDNQRDLYSVWSQQRTHFDNMTPICLTDPRQAFMDDLVAFLTERQASDDHLVVCLDANEDLTVPSNPVSSGFAAIRLRDGLFTRHDPALAPPTHQRGSRPIDGVFLSSVLPSSPSGYLPFGSAVGDHRPIWLDLDVRTLFRSGTPDSSHPLVARRLQCSDPRVVARYNQVLNDHYAQHNIPHRTFRLEQLASSGQWTPQCAMEWEALDQLRVEGIKTADARCRRLRTGHIPWSPVLSVALLTHRLWDRLWARSLGHKVSWSFLSRLARKIPITLPDAMDPSYIQEQRDSAWEEYKRVRSAAADHRQSYLAQLAQARADAGLEAQASALKVMVTRERQRKEARLLRSILRPGTMRKGLDRIEIPIGEGEWIDGEWNGSWMEVTSKTAIEDGCLRENDRRFRQASGTDLLQTLVIQALGPTGCTAAATELLRTGVVPTEVSNVISQPAREYLQQHHIPQAILAFPPAVPDFRTVPYAQGWARMREHTASGRSGLHFGHFVAQARDPILGSVDAALARIPVLTGFVPRRWTQGLNVMLEKKPGVAKVSKLRTILLYEADYNQNNKALGRTMMAYAERQQLLAPEQYGSRKHHSAVYQGLNKVLTFDLFRQQRQPGALCSNDAKSCYDRIGHTAAGLAMRRCGIPISFVEASLRPIQELRHYIRTTYGDSAIFFAADGQELPIQGIGQGNGGGPAIWAVVSTPIFNAMRQRGYGIFLRLPLTGDKYLFVGYAFVDDTDLVVNLPSLHHDESHADRVARVAARMQESVTFWEAALRASGGALVPQKCHWYLLDFRWYNGRWEMLPATDVAFPLRVRSPSGRQVPIEQLSPHEARRTLGIRAAPDGNMEAEMEFLSSRIQSWTELIRTRRLPHHLVWSAMHTGILRTLSYPLPATTFSEQQCRQLLHPLLQVGLSRSHIVRSMPRVVVHGPPERGGFAVPNLYTEQGIEHVKTILHFFQTPSITGYLLRASFQALQIELGLPGNPFDWSFSLWHKCATPTWLSHTWEFCSRYAVSFPDLRFSPMAPLRIGDCWIMESFYAAGIRSPTRLASLNWCRLALHAASLSDLATADSHYILPAAWQGTMGPCGRRYHWDWPRSPPSHELDWDDWREALVSTFGVERRFGRIQRPLGSWVSSRAFGCCALLSRRFNRLYCPDLDRSSETIPTRWRVYHEVPRAHGQPQFIFRGHYIGFAAVGLASPLLVADISARLDQPVQPQHTVRLRTVHPVPLDIPLSPSLQPPPSVLSQVTQDLPLASQYWFLKPNPESIDQLLGALHRGSLEAVSDGSARTGVDGTCAWCLAVDQNQLEAVSAGVRVPGPAASQHSFRSELFGLYNVAQFVRGLVRVGHGQGGSVTFATDSTSVLGRLLSSSRPASVSDQCWDLVSATQDILRSMPQVRWLGRHVRGHQDSQPGVVALDRWALRNVLMDERAARTYELVSPDVLPPSPVGLVPSVQLGPVTIVSDLAPALRLHVNGPPLTEYLHRHDKFGAGSSDLVHWDAYQLALCAQPLNRRHWILKSTMNRSAVGVEMLRRRQWRSASCPRCDFPTETATHVFLCPHPEVTELWDNALHKLNIWFARRFTHPLVSSYIIESLRAWRHGAPPPPLASSVPQLSAAAAAQRLLGWDAAFEGRWSLLWASVQDQYYRYIGRRNTGRRWLAALIAFLWDTAWDLWEHRNGHQVRRAQAQEQATLHAELRLEYDRGHLGLPRPVSALFRRPLEFRLRDAPGYQRLFLVRVQAARRRHPYRVLAEQRRLFRRFFRPAS